MNSVNHKLSSSRKFHKFARWNKTALKKSSADMVNIFLGGVAKANPDPSDSVAKRGLPAPSRNAFLSLPDRPMVGRCKKDVKSDLILLRGFGAIPGGKLAYFLSAVYTAAAKSLNVFKEILILSGRTHSHAVVFSSVAVSVAIWILFGIYLAQQASRMNTVEVLRHE